MAKTGKKAVYTNSSKKHSQTKNGSAKTDKPKPAVKQVKKNGGTCCRTFIFLFVTLAVVGVAVIYTNDEIREKTVQYVTFMKRNAMERYEQEIKPVVMKRWEEMFGTNESKQDAQKQKGNLEKLKKQEEENIRLEEEKKRKEAEKKKQEELRKQEEEKARLEKKKKEEEENKRKEAEKKKQEQLKKQEEEKKKQEELKKQEEEKKKQEELKKQEEEKARLEKKKQEELKKQEEEKKKQEELKKQQEEKKKQEELKKQEEEKKRLEAEKKKQEELKKQQEEKKRLEAEKKKQEELKNQEEAERKKQEELKKQQEEKKKQEELKNQEEAERKKQEELKKQEEEKKRLEAEKKKQEELKKQEEEKKRLEAEKKKQEELKKQEEAEKKKQEELKKQGEEKKRLEAEKKKQEELKKREEEKKRLEAEKKKQEELKKQEEEKKRLEMEKKKQEELKKQEEEKKKQEELKKQEEEKKRLEAEKKKQEELKKQEEEKKRLEAEKKKQEELKKQEEEKKKQEELKKQGEEKKKQEELKKQEEEKKRLEAEKKKQEELKKQEEEKKRLEVEKKKQEELKKQEESKRLEEEKKIKEQQEKKRMEEERRKAAENEKRKQEEDRKKNEEKIQAKISKDSYDKKSITSEADYDIREELDEAESNLYMTNHAVVLDMFEKILKKYPKSPRANFMKAEILEKMAAEQKSNDFLEQAITQYQSVLDLLGVPKDLLIKAGATLADKQAFRGWNSKASKTWRFLSDKYPNDVELKNKLGVSLLMSMQNEEARKIFKQVLEMDPANGYAKVHLGFIFKVIDNNPEKSIPLLTEGIASEDEGTRDGRFYFHLGDALQRLNQTENAYKVYQAGAENGLFLSMYQRSLYNIDTLTGRPWWTIEETGYQEYFKLLQDNWKTIRDEGLAQIDVKTGGFVPEQENLREQGDWKQFTLYQRGQKNKENCAKVPKTCELINKIIPAKTCSRGQIKYSVIHPGAHIWPHCGPTNCRIRSHLGLKIPPGLKIRVAQQTRTWEEGKFIIFDDSFEHEVWHDGNEFRLVLIVDFWHPELTEEQRRTLSPI